jgi:hypothetical protein
MALEWVWTVYQKQIHTHIHQPHCALLTKVSIGMDVAPNTNPPDFHGYHQHFGSISMAFLSGTKLEKYFSRVSSILSIFDWSHLSKISTH